MEEKVENKVILQPGNPSMGTDYARLSLKTQPTLRNIVSNLPTDIQVRILQSKASLNHMTNGSSISSYWSPLISQFLERIQMILTMSLS